MTERRPPPRPAPARRGHRRPAARPGPSARPAPPGASARGQDTLPGPRRPCGRRRAAFPARGGSRPRFLPAGRFRASPFGPPRLRRPARSRAGWSPAPVCSGPNSGSPASPSAVTQASSSAAFTSTTPRSGVCPSRSLPFCACFAAYRPKSGYPAPWLAIALTQNTFGLSVAPTALSRLPSGP